jgi:hypothetical protein
MISLHTFLYDFMHPGLDLLWRVGGPVNTVNAQRLLLAIATQESGLEHREQVGGPAHGWWQFEKDGGVAGVMTHHATRKVAEAACDRLRIPFTRSSVYTAITYNDYLAVAFARLLLYPDPHQIPGSDDEEGAWQYYIRNWRPGKPSRARWVHSWAAAKEAVA